MNDVFTYRANKYSKVLSLSNVILNDDEMFSDSEHNHQVEPIDIDLNDESNKNEYDSYHKDSTDSFNLYSGVIHDKPESPKNASIPIANKILFIVLWYSYI